MQASQRFLILGATGWLGHYLVPTLAERSADWVFALGRTKRFESSLSNVRAFVGADPLQVLEETGPAHVIHLGRGEAETDFAVHESLIDHQNQTGMRYLFASSANAVDADTSRAHVETDPPRAKSEYGKFKARCEEALLDRCNRPLAFRFAATHGWAPGRVARTEEFLKKLSIDDSISVQKGIVQNRSFVGELSRQIALLARSEKSEGVFHLGAADCSEEHEFLGKLAQAFGYASEKVVVTESGASWNLVTQVDRLRAEFPQYSVPSEAQALAAVASQPELSRYRRPR